LQKVQNERQREKEAEHWEHEFKESFSLGVDISFDFCIVACLDPFHRNRVWKFTKMSLKIIFDDSAKYSFLQLCTCTRIPLRVDVCPFSFSFWMSKMKKEARWKIIIA
jgi:hypothetical protein